MKKTKRLVEARVVMVTGLNADTFKLILDVGDVSPIKAGQFIRLAPAMGSSILYRPFSVFTYNRKRLDILIKKTGKNTQAFSSLKHGQIIGIDGPHGQPLFVTEPQGKYILAAGGIGTAGLGLAAEELSQHKLNRDISATVLLGAKDANHLIGKLRFENLGLTVKTICEDEGGGLVTDLLVEELRLDESNATVIACGPKLMLKNVAALCKNSGHKCLVIMEEIMACGTGSCKGCAVFFTDSTVKHVCQDGPAFDANLIDWEKTVPKPLPKAKKPVLAKTTLPSCNGHYLVLNNPIMNAAGCLGIEAIESGQIDISRFGALVPKSLMLKARTGNLCPRICETQGGMLNAIGIENPGIDKFISEELCRWRAFQLPIILNVSATSLEDFEKIARTVDYIDGISGLEVNLSCPNLEAKNTMFALDPALSSRVIKIMRRHSNTFIIAKLSPAAPDIASIAKAVVAAGADAVNMGNTMPAMDIDPYTGHPLLGNITGGLSGPALLPINLLKTWQIRQALPNVPIIGCGGISNGQDALKYFHADAQAVQVGTALFSQPDAITRIYEEVKNF